MKKKIQYLFIALLIAGCNKNPEIIYSNKSLNLEERIDALVSAMTLDEKIKLVSGTKYWNTNAIPRLKIPSLKSMNGPYGVRPYYKTPEYPAGVPDSIKATAYPVNVAMGATWNPELIEKTGIALAREVKGKHHHILLAPCVNIQRVPYGGRNFESFSEDPFLTSEMAVAYVKGVQSEKVIPTLKHYACNNTELNRFKANIVVDEQTLHEIYLPAFKASVSEAGALGFMTAYVKLNGEYCSESHYLLTDLLKRKWNFQGFVISDWGAVHNTVEASNAGLDLEMPDNTCFGQKLKDAIITGAVKKEVLDDKVKRLLRAMFLCDFYDTPNPTVSIDTAGHNKLAYQIASESIVLLRNERNLLPLDRQKIKSIAVIGPNANVARYGGYGSSLVIPYHAISPLEGIKRVAGNKIKVNYSPGVQDEKDILPIGPECFQAPDGQKGLKAEYFNNPGLEGEPAVTQIDPQIKFDWATERPHSKINDDKFSIRWTGNLALGLTGEYEISLGSNDGARLYINDKLFIDNSGRHPFSVKREKLFLKNENPVKIRVEYTEWEGKASVVLGLRKYIAAPLEEAIKVASISDVAIICAGLGSFVESEGSDIKSLSLPKEQERLIHEIKKANPNTVVVLNSGTPLYISKWIDEVPALLEAWYPGQEGGNALADILFGEISPSGKLPQSWTKKWEDAPAFGWYPDPEKSLTQNGTTDIDDNKDVKESAGTLLKYGEGIFVGYRYFDKMGIDPMFPFGFGLSYTRFECSDLNVELDRDKNCRVVLNVKNTGKYSGREIIQVYIHYDADSLRDRPVKELKAFKKVFLLPNENKRIALDIDHKSLTHYDTKIHEWRQVKGNIKVLIGTSSKDIWSERNITL